MTAKTTMLLATMLVLGAIPLAPTVAAHTCSDHYNCDSSACVDGEDHDHTDLNDPPFENTSCSSRKEDAPGWCRIVVDLPPVVCRLIETTPIEWNEAF